MDWSHKNRTLFFAIVGILALLGLIFVQIFLLRTGILLEKERLDQKMAYLMRQAAIEISENEDLSAGISTLYLKKGTTLQNAEKNLPRMLKDSLHFLIEQNMNSQHIETDFSFALVQQQAQHILVASPGYETKETKNLIYDRALSGKIFSICHCSLELKIHLNDLYKYLLSRLSLLIILSILFTGLLLFSLLLLISSSNKLKKLNDLKNDFINNLTHEFKTPVFSISLISKLLEENIKKGNKKKNFELLNLLKKENEQIKTHTEKVLELASLESSNYKLEPAPVEMHDLLRNLKIDFDIKLREKEGQINLLLLANNTRANIDPTHFKNALRNLLDNALKYTDKKPVIEIKTLNQGNKLQISIADNGPGIPVEHQKRVFEKFYRVPSGNLHTVKGFGLGLSYVKRIVYLHDGNITLNSQKNKGSEFVILLPFIDTSPKEGMLS